MGDFFSIDELLPFIIIIALQFLYQIYRLFNKKSKANQFTEVNSGQSNTEIPQDLLDEFMSHRPQEIINEEFLNVTTDEEVKSEREDLRTMPIRMKETVNSFENDTDRFEPNRLKIKGSLKDKKKLKRAIVLSELIGKPNGLEKNRF